MHLQMAATVWRLTYLFTNTAEYIFIFEERLVMGPVSHRGKELNGVGHK